MNVVISGSSSGMGFAAANLFLERGHRVFGLDLNPCRIENENYEHFICDVSDFSSLPEIQNAEILVINAGIQSQSEKDIQVNLLGAMNTAQKYAFQSSIRSVLFNASVSALNGNEFPHYVASKAGVVGYMKHCAIRLANEFRATCNALCFGGVKTELNRPVMENPQAWQKIMDITPLKRWAEPREAAEWIYFMTAVNTFCTGQAIDISGGERNCADLFVWED